MHSRSVFGTRRPSIRMDPDVAGSSPPNMRRRVDFPPPDEPISASALVSTEKDTSSITFSPPKRLTKCSSSTFIAEPLFKQPAHKRNRKRENEIKHTEEKVALHELEIDRTHFAHGLRKFDHRNH